ncbi:MAG TPA: DedA family protein [Acidimicrobiales bacterium]|nr:DedA family protein [Acidimicrobiales bacterium]
MEHFISSHGYVAVFLLMVAEAACVPIPSEVIMMLGGALSGVVFATTVAHVHPLNVGVVGAVGTAGDLVGACIAYWVGRLGGRPLVERWGRYVRLRTHELDRAERWFERRGEVTVLVSRVLPVVRTFISLPAGIAEMRFSRFVVFTILGSLPWTFSLALAGHAIGAHWKGVADAFRPASYVIAVLAVAAIAWWLLRRRGSRAEPANA